MSAIRSVIDAMDYFRGVLKSDELSLRVLSLTARVIDLNAANYTAWCHRRKVRKSR